MDSRKLILPGAGRNLAEGKDFITELIKRFINACAEDIAVNKRGMDSKVRHTLDVLLQMRSDPLALQNYNLMQTIAGLSKECGWDSRLASIGWYLYDLHKDLIQLSRLLDKVDFRILQTNIEQLVTPELTEDASTVS